MPCPLRVPVLPQVTMVLTLVAALKFHSVILCIFFIAIQFCALVGVVVLPEPCWQLGGAPAARAHPALARPIPLLHVLICAGVVCR